MSKRLAADSAILILMGLRSTLCLCSSGPLTVVKHHFFVSSPPTAASLHTVLRTIYLHSIPKIAHYSFRILYYVGRNLAQQLIKNWLGLIEN